MRFDNFGGSELNGRDPRGISIANGLNSTASRVVRGLVGWVLFRLGIVVPPLGPICFIFISFFYRLRSQITDGMVVVVFGFLAGSADTLVCGERKT